MNFRRYYATLLLLLTTMVVGAQNKLSIPDLEGAPGKTVSLPLTLTNSDEILAVQFTLQLPYATTTDVEPVLSDQRSSGCHTIGMRHLGSNRYMVLITNLENRPIPGNGGTLAEIPMKVSGSAQPGETHQIKLTDIVLADRSGKNVCSQTNADAATFTIQRTASPDLECSAVGTLQPQVLPGQELKLSWTVKNIGEQPTGGGWKENISLVNSLTGYATHLGTTYHNESLAAQSSVSREETIVLPQVLAMDEDAYLRVNVVPNSDVNEFQTDRANNTATSTQAYAVGKALFLSSPVTTLTEGTTAARITLTRSGDRSLDETVTLTQSVNGVLEMPAKVIIPGGQSSTTFDIKALDNDDVNEYTQVTLKATSAQTGVTAASLNLDIQDEDVLPLTMKTDKSEYNEGETIHGTLTVPRRIGQDDLVAFLVIEQAKRFRLPLSVVFEPGQTTAQFEVPVLQDNIPANAISIELSATAEHYEKASTLFILNDDDVPAINLSLNTTSVSEGAGPQAIHATITRTDVTTSNVTVNLTDNSGGELLYTPSITLEEGITQKTVIIGVKDNNLVDGEREVKLKAEVFISSCNCNVVGDKQTSVFQTITLLDNDGPALTLAADKSTILEGDVTGTTITVTRNTSTVQPLTVQLTASPSGLTLPAQVTIPAGAASTTFTLSAKSNDVQEGNYVANVTAQATGFVKGSAWVMVSDQTLPDMQLTQLTLSNNEVVAGDEFSVSVQVTNVGAAPVPERSKLSLQAAGQSITLTIPEVIPVGGSQMLTANFTAPEIPGLYNVVAEANHTQDFTELQTLNNQATQQLVVESCYTLSIQTDKQTYNQGEIVILRGAITSLRGNVEGLKVEPYIMYYGARTTLDAIVQDDGTFLATYQLPEGMGGEYGFGVCIPGENATSIMSKANVYGIARKSASYIKAYYHPNETIQIDVPVMNLSALPLHNLKATFTDESGHVATECPVVALVEGNAEVTLHLTSTSTAVTKTQDWERVKVDITTDEGASLNFIIYTFTSSPTPQLTLSTTQLSTTLNKDRGRIVPITLTNLGMGETGRVTVDIPKGQKFVSLASSAEIPSLAYGDSVTVMLRFNPEGLDANVVQKGSIAFNCSNGDGKLFYYNLKTVSDEKGNLLVRVQDENTIYGNAAGGHPYVSGATVTIKDYNNGVVLYTQTTGEDGYVKFEDVNEGAYLVHVTAPKHDSYTQNLIVSPGETTEHLASISYQAVSVSWDVEETTVEDKYEIKTELVYETRVPVPVVTCTYPDQLNLDPVMDGVNMLFNIVVRNEGLITAQNVCVVMPERNGFEFTPLTEFQGFTLAPEQSRVIPVYVSYTGNTPVAIRARYQSPKREVTYTCTDEVMWGWEWICKETSHAWLQKPIQWLLRTCTPHGTPDDAPKPKVNPSKPEPIHPPVNPGPTYDPVYRHFRYTNSQVDIGAIYQLTCKLLCAAMCWIPDIPMLPCTPVNLATWEFEAPELDCLVDFAPEPIPSLYCTYKALNKDYVPARHRAVLSRKEILAAKVDLYEEVVKNGFAFYSQLINAPELMADNTTLKLVLPGITDANWKMNQLHEAGKLYDLSLDELNSMLLKFMPQERGQWHDFDLKTYVQRQINTYRLRDGLDFDATNVFTNEARKALQDKADNQSCRLADFGYSSWETFAQSIYDDAKGLVDGDAGTCATVKLEIKQEMVLTRQAFRGTLVIDNSSETELTDIEALITATDENGQMATSHEMQINMESSEGFSVGADGKLSLAPGGKGTVTYLFIPTKYAAPENDVRYSFGGILYFNDGNDLQARSLYPVTLTVRPTPELDLTYFMQSDIYGDDPLTLDIVEPVIPAEFTVLINNKGKGDAQNLRMVTHQPQIVENEKGLLVDFAIVSSSLNGGETSMALEDNIATDFGNIPAGSTSYATWGLTSSLLGHFTDYDVSYTHVTSYDNPDLSLLDEVTIHKLVHSVNAKLGGKTYRAWVTDDFTDTQNEPDHIYFSNGTDERLETLNDVTTIETLDATHYRITVQVPIEEWFYLNVNNPGGRRSNVISLVNEDTGEALDLQSIWTTQYTLRQGKNPLEEYRLHLVDKATEKCTRRYIVEFEPMAEKELDINITGVPEGNDIATAPLSRLYVRFNKPIDPATFTREDITLRYEGKQIDDPLSITQVNETLYTINTSDLISNGYYALQIHGDGITDAEGFAGTNGSQVRWTLYQGGMVHYMLRSYPSPDFGTITGATVGGLTPTEYGSLLNILATASVGSKFVHWGIPKADVVVAQKARARVAGLADETAQLKESDFDVFSENPAISIDMIRDYNLYAIFRPNQYNVSVHCDPNSGSVNLVSGSYAYGDKVHLVATPAEGYVAEGFVINGVQVSTAAEMDYTVQDDDNIDVLFRSLAPIDVILTENRDYTPEQIDHANVILMRSFVKGMWNTICLPCPVDDPVAVFGKGTRVARLERYEEGFVNFALVDRMLPNVPYLIQPGSLLTGNTPDGEVRTTTYQLGLTAIHAIQGDLPADQISGLSFIGTYTQEPLDTDAGNFYLSGNKFYYVDDAAQVESRRFRAYFHVDDASVKTLYFWTDGTATGIESPAAALPSDGLYGVDGIKHSTSRNLQRGIYITNGRKLLVK